MHMRSAICAALILFALAGCSRQPGTAAAQRATSQSPSATALAPQPGQKVTGTVLETMDAAGYTYARLKTAGGEVWAALPQSKMAVGDSVSITVEMPSSNFHSPTLNRDFPLLYFASRADAQGGAVSPSMEGQPPASSMMSAHGQGQMTGAPATEPVTTKIAPAPGGVTVADVWTRRAALAGKTVTVRGKVVKFNGGILDRNWMHIQDGTGDAKDGTNDLAITSQGVAKVGDIITATGKLTVNKDIGSGYKYSVIVEDATIK